MKAFARFLRVLSLTAFCVACGGGGAGALAPPALSANANLGTLTLIPAILEQAFDPNQTTYTAVVGFLIASIHVEVSAEDGAATLTVNGAAVDPAGVTVALAEGNNDIAVQVTAANGTTTRTYTVTRQSAAAFAEGAYVKASNTDAGDRFGGSVALSGDTLAVGAEREDSAATGINGDQSDNSADASGAVYVFTRDDAGVWSQQAYIKASNTDRDDRFGVSVALAGNTLVVGAEFEDSAATGIDGDQSNNNASGAGAVYVFTRDAAGIWSQQAYIKASNSDVEDWFGFSVALSDDTLAVGAYNEASAATGINGNQGNNNVSESGAVYVFTRDAAGIWSQQAYIKASNTGRLDLFGFSVALAGDTLAVGAFREASAATGINGNQSDNNANRSGAVYVFTRDPAGIWSQQAYVKASNTDTPDFFGWSVALSGDTLAVGARNEASAATGINGDQSDNSVNNAGAVYVFTRDAASIWSQQAYVKASNTDAGDYFGFSVALAGNTLVVGAEFEDSAATGIDGDQSNNNAFVSGAIYVFTRDAAGVWSQQAYIKASNSDAGDSFGGSVALSGDTLAVGAEREESATTGINGDQSDNSVNQSGAAFVLE